MDGFLSSFVENGTIPGAVGVWASPDAEPQIVAVGTMGPGGAPMRADAIVRIQSMTKPIIAVATLRLVEAGLLFLDDDVTRWLPELADRRVLREPAGPLAETVEQDGPITVRHLLTNMSGYGMAFDGPLAEAMKANGTEAGPEPVALGADEWLARLAELPLTFQPGEGWRYHHSFGVLGVLLQRLVARPLGEHLRDDVFAPLGMPDTGFYVPADRLDRLPGAYRLGEAGLEETEPPGDGFYAGPPPFDVCHAELVSTASDYLALCRMLAADGRLPDGTAYLGSGAVDELCSDHVPAAAKTPESFMPGFWDGLGWGYGVSVRTDDPHRGRYGWSGGQGTDFFIDPDGSIGILLTQVELGPRTFGIIEEFQETPWRTTT